MQNVLYWQTPKAGAIDRLSLLEEPIASPVGDEIQVRIHAVGLNFADIFALTALYSATPKGPFTPGLEFSGVISALGPNHNSAYAVGDAVMGVTRFGGYRSYIHTQASYIQPLPEQWSHEQGAAYLVQTLTAWYALTSLGNLQAGQRVLIHSAAGGVGLQAMRLATALGASVIGSVGSPHKLAFLHEQGFDQVIVRSSPFSEQLQQHQPFDLVLDGVGGDVQRSSFNHLNPMGRLVVFGAAEFTPGKNRPHYLKALWQYLFRPKYDVMDMISANKSVLAFNLIWLWEQAPLLRQLIEDMMDQPIAPPHVGHIFDFTQAAEAIETLRLGQTCGKVVLKVDHS